MFVYCGNNTVATSDPSGESYVKAESDLWHREEPTIEEKVYSISQKHLYSKKILKQSSLFEKKILLTVYMREVSQAMDLEIDSKINFYYSNSTERGKYNDKTKSISINIRMLDDNKGYNTVRHELRHAFQYSAVRGMNTCTWTNSTNESYETLFSWFINIQPGNYISGGKRGYRKQPIEADAFSWAAKTGPF